MAKMNNQTKIAIGLSIGGAVAGGVVYWLYSTGRLTSVFGAPPPSSSSAGVFTTKTSSTSSTSAKGIHPLPGDPVQSGSYVTNFPAYGRQIGYADGQKSPDGTQKYSYTKGWVPA